MKIVKRKDIGADNPEYDYFCNIDEVYSALACVEMDSSKQHLNCNISSAVNYIYESNNKNPRDSYVFCIAQNEGLYYGTTDKSKENLSNIK